jgi:hypothetical protein
VAPIGRPRRPGDAWSLRLGAEALFSAGSDDEAVTVARRRWTSPVRGQLIALTQSLEFMALADARRVTPRRPRHRHRGLDLVTALGQPREERIASGTAAWIEGLLGREDACRAHAARAPC